MNTDQFTGQRAVIYTRISKDRTREGLGVERQESECRRYADERGMHVVEVLQDNDMSGYSGRNRPDFERLKSMIDNREIEAVIYWKQDRLTRKQSEFFGLVDLITPRGKGDPGVGLHAPGDTAEGHLDLTTAAGALNASIVGALAQYESAVKRDRMKLRQRQKAVLGEWLGGVRPFGWNKVGKFLEVHEAEAEVLRQAGADLIAGKSLHSIVRGWADPERRGGSLKSTLGKKITVQSLKQMLTRTRNIGETVTDFDDGQEPVVVQSPPIMSKDMFESIGQILNDPNRRISRSNKAKHMLSGIAQCHCGNIVRTLHGKARPNKNGNRKKYIIYACTSAGKGHVNKRKEYVDTVVELFVFRALIEDLEAHGDDPKVLEELEQLRGKLDTFHERRRQGGSLFASGAMDAGQLAEFNKSMDDQTADVEARIENLGIVSTDKDTSEVGQVLREYRGNDKAFREWRRSPMEDRRAWLRARFHIVLRPHHKGSSRTFDTDTVSIYPRQRGERGRRLSAEEVENRPVTPITTGGMPPSLQNLYPDDDGTQVTETWPQYLNMFAAMSGFGWMDGFNVDPGVADSRYNWEGHWKDPLSE